MLCVRKGAARAKITLFARRVDIRAFSENTCRTQEIGLIRKERFLGAQLYETLQGVPQMLAAKVDVGVDQAFTDPHLTIFAGTTEVHLRDENLAA